MGVHGLWKLLEPSGRMVPLESLAGKVLAIDISIWLHQAVKGMHDAHGAPMAVAHLLILFHRLCKLLFYRIKPVFVFDGGVPLLKTQTMAARRQRSSAAKSEALKVREKLIKNLLKHEAVRQVLSNETASAALGLNSFTLPGPSVEEDLYKLPPIATDYVDSECSEEEISGDEEENEKHGHDIHSIDVTSQEFLSLPAEVRHDILTELIETRKQSSWKYLDSMPKQSENFSDFQMGRLLKRHAVQTSLEKAGKEMGGRALSLKELEALLGDQGVLDPKLDLPSKRIAQDNVTRYMLVQKDNTEESSRKFDVMEHLEDVDWSSESDTDVILDRKKDVGKSREETKKIEMPSEVADILSILEENDTADVKMNIKNTESDLDSTKILTKTKENVDSELSYKIDTKNDDTVSIDSENKEPINKTASKVENVIKEQPKIKNEHISEPFSDSEQKKIVENVKTAVEVEKNAIVPTANSSSNPKKVVEEKIVNNEHKIEEITSEEKKTNENENFEASKEKETSTDSKCRNIVEIANVKEKLENEIERNNGFSSNSESAKNDENEINFDEKQSDQFVDSSSDSESDFIPITSAETERVLPDATTKTNSQPSVSDVTPARNESLTVFFNPSEVSNKDDLFADIFDNPNEKEMEKGDKGGDDEGRIVEKNEFEGNVSMEELNKNLEEEHFRLIKEKGKQERHALNLNDQIYTDAQELLRLFGVPFIVAPMEAEAQCAALNALNLTEGTITDDSDIWLFGGRVVYKNFFNQNKHVLEYRSENIEKNFKLTREEMIKMALLVGSDYTVGLNGIGPVTALEIIASFKSQNGDPLKSLQKFREWFLGTGRNDPPRAGLRKKMKNTLMTPGFPSRAVMDAYLNPLVDDSKEPFSWAKPNLDLIQKYVRMKMGWSKEKCNDLLEPVMKKLQEKNNQTTIEKHFKFACKAEDADVMLSKRVENAIKRLGNCSRESDEPETEPGSDRESKRKGSVAKGRKKKAARSDESKPGKKQKTCDSFPAGKNDDSAKLKLIKAKLHQSAKVPQREMAQKALENNKREAIKIFRTFGKPGKKKRKVYAREEANLSESSSDD